MNKKGFTLIELLAVIVILAVVMLIGSSSISAVKNGIDRNMFETRLSLIIAAGKKYGERNKNLFLDASGLTTNTITKSVADLLKERDLESDETEIKSRVSNCSVQTSPDADGDTRCVVITNPIEGNVLNDLTLTIYMENNRVYACIPLTDSNKAIMYDTSCTKTDCSENTCTWNDCEYSDLHYYCVKY